MLRHLMSFLVCAIPLFAGAETALPNTTFFGQTTFANGLTKPVRISFRTLSDDSDAAKPRVAHVQFEYASSASLVIAGSLWHGDHFMGQTFLPNGLAISVDCSVASSTLKCINYNNLSGNVAMSEAEPEVVPGFAPLDASLETKTIRRVFYGWGRISADPSALRRVSLTLIRPAQSSLQSITDLFSSGTSLNLQVEMAISENVSVSFPSATWNKTKDSLDASNPSQTSDGHMWNPELHCTGFRFIDTAAPFACAYCSNRSPNLSFLFEP